MSSKATHNFKIVLAGDASTGKSSIVLRITENEFENLPPTIGCDFKKHETRSSTGERVNLIMWDTAGEEKYQSIMSSYYRGAHAVILVYDVTNRASFEHIESTWLDQVDLYCTRGADHCTLMLLANKIDLTESGQNFNPHRAVTTVEGISLAKRRGMLFGECSTKTDTGIREALKELVDKLLETTTTTSGDVSNPSAFQLNSHPSLSQDSQNGGCAC